jgi:hypothetical protein
LVLCVGCQTAANPLFEFGHNSQSGSGGGSGGKAPPVAMLATGGSVGREMPLLPNDDHPDAAADVVPTPPTSTPDAAEETDLAPKAPFTGDVTKGLALYLPLDERPGTSVAPDASGKKSSAQLRSIDANAAWTVGATGQALALQGTSWNGWVDVSGASLASVISESFSVALWVFRPTAATTTETLVARTSLGAKGPLFALNLENGVLTVQLNSTAAYNFRLKANGTVPTGRWAHVAMTFDLPMQQVRLYVDGNAVGAGQYAQAVPLDNTSFMVGGLEQSNRSVSARFAGQIDEVLIYTRALAAKDVAGLASGVRPQIR